MSYIDDEPLGHPAVTEMADLIAELSAKAETLVERAYIETYTLDEQRAREVLNHRRIFGILEEAGVKITDGVKRKIALFGLTEKQRKSGDFDHEFDGSEDWHPDVEAVLLDALLPTGKVN